MKKLAILFILVSFIFVGCKANPATTQNESDTNNQVSEISENIEVSEVEESTEIEVTETTEATIDLSVFPEIKPEASNIGMYRNDITKRANGLYGDQFLTEEESHILRDAGYYVSAHGVWISYLDKDFAEVSTYYYPIVYRYGESLVLWYTYGSGNLYYKTIYGPNGMFSNYGGNVHLDESTNDEIIGRYEGFALSYNSAEGTINQWKCGKINHKYSVPAGSIYCGESHREGYLFRSGSDVYSLTFEGSEAICIAHGVKYVLESNYAFNSDAAFQPLFLMESGEILAYVGFSSLGEMPDDPRHLLPTQIEGGYR